MTSSKFLTGLPRAEDDGTGDAGTDAADAAALADPEAVGCKSVAAYRTGFAID